MYLRLAAPILAFIAATAGLCACASSASPTEQKQSPSEEQDSGPDCPTMAASCPAECSEVVASRVTATCIEQGGTVIGCAPRTLITFDQVCVQNLSTQEVYLSPSGTWADWLSQPGGGWQRCSPALTIKPSCGCPASYDLASYSGDTSTLCPAAEATVCACAVHETDRVQCDPKGGGCVRLAATCDACGWLDCTDLTSAPSGCSQYAAFLPGIKSGAGTNACTRDTDCGQGRACSLRIGNRMFCESK